MKPTAFVFLCFSLLFPAAWAADPAPPSPTDTYITARDRYIAEFKNLPDRGSHDKRAVQALADVERLLRAAVSAWTAPGFPATGEISLNCMDDNAMGFSVLDGLVYRADDTSVVVTNRALLMNAVPGHNRGYGSKVPLSIPAAFGDENFWTFAVGCDAGASLHKMMVVKAPEGADSVTVALAGFHNGLDYDATPDQLVAAVVRGDRVFVARENLKVVLAPAPHCWKKLIYLEEHSEVQKDDPRAWDRELGKYRTCFDRHLRKQPAYAAVQEQAQALVDLLH